MNKILISSCLLGEKVRYDGGHCLINHPIIKQWQNRGLLLSFCPEMASGLTSPRTPVELVEGQAFDLHGNNKTTYFTKGARMALKLVREKQIKMAILKDKSPSCGVERIYDGSFNKRLILGQGISSSVLKENGIKVFSENQLDLAQKYHQTLFDI